ncbi:MAG: long-chain fatty acid--CoA ligase [Actinomycetota bacterium]|nr:long-chain fatty acid--CoA ligase [Actinomycetota bacterium]
MPEYTPRFNTLPEILEHARAEHGHRPFLGTKEAGAWTWMSHAEFGEAADQARGGFANLGVGKGDPIAIVADNRSEWAIAAYGAYGLGAAVVPMYEAQKDENWRYILLDSRARVAVVANEDIRDRISAMRGDLPDLQNLVVLDGESNDAAVSFVDMLERGKANPVDVTPLDANDIAGFVYTSGTTGNPKGVILSHSNFASNVSAITEVFPIESDDRTLSFLPWAHAFGQTVELHVLLAKGASTAFAQGTRTIMPFLGEVSPTMLVSVPRIFNTIYDALGKRMEKEGGVKNLMFDTAITNETKRRRLADEGNSSRLVEMQHQLFDRLVFSKVRDGFGGRLKYAISGGAAIATDVANFIDSLGIKVYEGYGLSETSPIVTANFPGTRKIGSVGTPIPGVTVSIDNENRAGDDGEVVVYGHCVMQGYHNLTEQTAAVLTEDGGFRTGDLGRLDKDGFLFITGRIKEQYKLENGKYVVPTPLEEKISLSPYISNAIVFGDNKPFNVGLLVLDDDAVAGWAATQDITVAGDDLADDERVRGLIRQELEKQLADTKGYERVKKFAILDEDFTVDNGMLTPTLKLKRNVVVDHYGDKIKDLYS